MYNDQDLWIKFYSMDLVNDVRTMSTKHNAHNASVYWVGRNSAPIFRRLCFVPETGDIRDQT